MPKIPQPEVRDSDFGEFQAAAAAIRPDTATVSAVRLWGIDWTCSFDAAGRVQQVKIGREWLAARLNLRDTLCDELERAFAEMPA